MRSNSLIQTLNQINMQQHGTDTALKASQENLSASDGIKKLTRQALSYFLDAFVSFFGNRTLNLGDTEDIKKYYPKVIRSLARAVDGDTAGTLLTAHCRNYQSILLPNVPQEHAVLPAGYFLFRTHNNEITQIHVIISHANSDPKETINLSEKVPPENIRILLDDLNWPQPNQQALPVSLHHELMQWIASFSQCNKTAIRPYDIFWNPEVAEKFSRNLSKEARAPQNIAGDNYKALVTENGWWASAGAFFGNAAATIWHLGKPPKTYGYDTVLYQSDQDRMPGVRDGEITLILSTIANRFVQNNVSEIDRTVREKCQNKMRPI